MHRSTIKISDHMLENQSRINYGQDDDLRETKLQIKINARIRKGSSFTQNNHSHILFIKVKLIIIFIRYTYVYDTWNFNLLSLKPSHHLIIVSR